MRVTVLTVLSCLLLCKLLLASSAVANTFQIVDTSNYPDWFTDALARESAVKGKSTIKIEALGIKAEIKGKANLAQTSEDYWYYTIDIGVDTPVECHIFTTFDGPANSLISVIDATLPQLEQIYGKKLASRQTFSIGVGVVGKTPYMQLDTLYTMGEGDGLISGTLKGFSARTGDSLQICFHNEVGNRAAFLETFTSFIEGVNANKTSNHFYENALTTTINGIPMGYILEQHSLDADGDVYTRQETAMLIPMDASSVSRTDTIYEQFGGTDGSLINTYEFTVENGTLGSEFSVSVKDDKWHVDGQMQGKEVKGVLEYDGWLLSAYGSYLATAELLKSEEKSADYHMWVSDADPLSALPVTLSKIEDDAEANINLKVGPIDLQYLANPDGTFEKLTIEQAGATMVMTPLFVIGKPSLEQ